MEYLKIALYSIRAVRLWTQGHKIESLICVGITLYFLASIFGFVL